MNEGFTKVCDVTVSQEHYTADACIVWCFDDRFSEALERFVRQQGIARCDLVKIAGGSKTLAQPEHVKERGFVFRQIETSLKLHHAKRIILMNHSDCGAYGGLAAFGNDPEQEREKHAHHLVHAKKLVEKAVVARTGVRVPVEAVFVDFTGVWRL